MYKIIIPNSVKRDLKKLDKDVARGIIQQLENLAQNPMLGTTLSGNLSNLRKLNVRRQNTEYRIVYKIVREHIEIHVIHIGTRENFYDELRRRL